jgi:hypothetical protein
MKYIDKAAWGNGMYGGKKGKHESNVVEIREGARGKKMEIK